MISRIVSLFMAIFVSIPFFADAQSPTMVAKVGLLSTVFTRSFPPFQAMTDELRKLGYYEGHNLVFEFRTADGKVDRLPALAEEIAPR